MKTPFVLLALLGLTTFAHADWLQFRGPNGASIAADNKQPADALKVAWTTSLPGRGLSAPIIVGDKVFITAASGPSQETLHVFCFKASDGSKVWERTMRATGRTMSHTKTCVAAPTPCSDGKHVFALYSSNDLFAFDLDGNLKWLRGLTYDYANASNSLGMSQSPVVAGGVLVVQSENDSESFAAGIDIATGRNKWKIDRPKAANWSSAIVYQAKGLEPVVGLQSSKGLLGVDPQTGKQVWNYGDGASTIPSSALSNGVIYAPSNGITALVPEGSSVSQLWRNDKLSPGTSSPIALGDHVYVVNKAGVVIQASIKDGAENWKLRLEGPPFSGSPVGAGKMLYIVSERGTFQAIDTTAKEGAVTQTIALGETVLTTPAIDNGALYVRSDGKLWKIQ